MKRKAAPQINRVGVTMSGSACDIAVSEITGIDLGDLCTWVIIGARHKGDAHEPVIVPRTYEAIPHVIELLEYAAASLRTLKQ